MDTKYTKVILANMCMVYDDNGNILVQMRTRKDWPGLTFPGGHVEDGETLDEAMIREIKEETGLTIKHPILCGIKEWPWENGTRYLGLLYKCNEFEGKLCSSEEGKVFWIKEDELFNFQLSQDLEELYRIIISK